jgi:hypothetical protein
MGFPDRNNAEPSQALVKAVRFLKIDLRVKSGSVIIEVLYCPYGGMKALLNAGRVIPHKLTVRSVIC